MDAEWRRAIGRAWWIAIPVALSAAASFRITRNYFFGDDLLSLYQVVNQPLGETLLAPYGGHELIVRNALLAGLYAVCGAQPWVYYWTAVLTHVGNVALLAVLIRMLTDSARLACFGAALWGTAPVTDGTIGWYAVYGHALATTALLVVLTGVLGAGRRGAVSRTERAGWAVLLWAASTCFGVGLAFVMALPIMAWLLLPATPVQRRIVRFLTAVAVVVSALYVGAEHLGSYLYGVPSETPALGATLRKSFGIADLIASMYAYGIEQLVLGPLAHFAPDLTWAAAVAAPIVAAVGLAMKKAAPAARRAMAAFLVLGTATYGIIAAGRAPFYPELRDLLVRADRYHYAALLAVTVLLCLALAQAAGPALTARARSGALIAWLLALAVALALARAPIDNQGYARQLADEALATMHEIIHSAEPGEDVYIANEVFLGVGPLVVTHPRNFPGWAALFAVYHRSDVVDGRRVFFVEPDWKVRIAQGHGRRSATLLVAPNAVPPERVRRATPPVTVGAEQ